jgi:hypothetical protein
MDERVARVAAHEVFDQGSLTGTRFAGDRNDASASGIRLGERAVQALQLIIPL